MNIDQYKKFSQKYLLLQHLKARVKEIEKEVKEEQNSLIDNMIDEGVDKISLNGGITLFIKTLIWAKYPNKEAAIKAIKSAKLNELISENFDSKRLASFLRELDREGKDLPDAFKGVIEPNPTQSLIAKKL